MATRAFTPHGTRRSRLELALSRELHDGERVLWRGTPTGRVNATSFLIYAFAVPWTAFSLFWTAMASTVVVSPQSDGLGAFLVSLGAPLFGLPFVLVGLAMLGSPFLPKWERDKVLFAITSQRLLKLRLWRSLDVTSCPADRIGQVLRRERRDGSGSVSIAVKVGKDSDGDPSVERFIIDEVANIFEVHAAVEYLAGRD